jgi:hypothetical protein
MKYNYATEVAAGACPGCGKPVILYHHVRLTTGEERRKLTALDTIFCRECVERMNQPAQPCNTQNAPFDVCTLSLGRTFRVR